MPLPTYPLLAWGTPDNIAGGSWTNNGTPTVTSSVSDPFGGTGAYTIDDNDAGSAEARLLVVGACTGTRLTFAVAIKQGTATASTVQVRDQTAAAYKIQATTTWSGGVPGTPSMASGTYVGQVALGSGWYLLLLSAAWTNGNSARLELYGASGTASATGTTSYYLRNMVPLSFVDRAVSFSRPREGSDFRQGPSGTEESWVIGPDEILRCQCRWVPNAPRADPTTQAGWAGENEYAGVNVGLKALIEAGWQKNSLVWVPDRSDCATYQTGYLTEPMGEDIGIEANGPFRTFPLELRGTSPFMAD